MAESPLVLVSNRGPVTFEAGGAVRRGTGGLVTALIGLASHREVTWIASAMTDEDVLVAERHGGRPFPVTTPEGDEYRVKLVASDADAYDRFYNIIANPMLWFIQHYLWDLSNAPDIRRNETEAFEFGYNVVNEDLAHAVLEEIEGVEQPVVMVHDYHLYTLPALIRRERPDAFLHHFVHIPWSQSDSWRVLPAVMREEIYDGILANDIIGFHTRSYRRNFLQCCEDLLGLEVDHDAGVVQLEDREVWVRAYPLPIDSAAVRPWRGARACGEFEEELLRRRRDHLILRVDRADLSKNVLRGFSAFDVFLEQHPEFRERVTFIAQLMPSRTDVPEYAEYLERIEAVVAVVNHRHGSPGLDADPAQAARRPRGGGRRLQALRRADRQRDVRRHEPGRQGGPDGQRARRRLDPVGEHRRPRGARRVRAVGQPVRHPGAGRLDPRRADDAARGARAPPRGPDARSSPRAIRATGSTSSSPTSRPRRARWRARAARRGHHPAPARTDPARPGAWRGICAICRRIEGVAQACAVITELTNRRAAMSPSYSRSGWPGSCSTGPPARIATKRPSRYQLLAKRTGASSVRRRQPP